MSPLNCNKQVTSMATIATIVALIGAYVYYRNKRRNRIPKEWTTVGTVKQLFVFPLKSGRRRELQSAECTKYGVSVNVKNVELKDRCFVVYGENNNEFKTARVYPKLVLIETSVDDNGDYVFTAPGQDLLTVKAPSSEGETIYVTLHNKAPCGAVDCGDEAALWLSRYLLDKPAGLRLGYNTGRYRRDIEKQFPKYQKFHNKLKNDSSGLYQDLTSYHLVSQQSVDELNKNLDESVTADNFRPNILVDGVNLKPYAEENWDWIKIGDVVFRNVKPCTRCILTTVDPEGGTLSKVRQPLKTLEKTNYLKDPGHVKCEGAAGVMGIHLGMRKTGQIKIGDEVSVA